jgi:hypothetical protein
MVFQEDVEQLSNIAVKFLQDLEREPKESELVKKYIEDMCKKIREEGWLEQKEERPWIRTFERENYILRVAFIHARRGEHITGADLSIELKDRKIIFVQTKKVGSEGRIYFNRFQLQKLIELEWQICVLSPYRDIHEWIKYMHDLYRKWLEKLHMCKEPLYTFLPFLHPYYPPFRATFYQLVMKNKGQIEERFFHTSEVSFTLAGRGSISQKEFLGQGIKPDEFQKMFWECIIGCPDVERKIKKELFRIYSLTTNRLIIWLNIELRK